MNDYPQLFKQVLDKDKQYLDLIDRHIAAMRSGLYIEATKYKERANERGEILLKRFLAERENEYITLSEAIDTLPPKEAATVIHRMDSIRFLVDILETCVIDINEAFQKSSTSLDISSINDLSAMCKRCSEFLKDFQPFEYEKQEQLYADYVSSLEDNMFYRSIIYRNKLILIEQKEERKKCKKKEST